MTLSRFQKALKLTLQYRNILYCLQHEEILNPNLSTGVAMIMLILKKAQ